MTSMKTLIATLITCISFSSFAGGGGGGGVLMSALHTGNCSDNLTSEVGGTGGGGVFDSSVSTKEMVYFQGEDQGLVIFAYAQLVEKKWQIQKLIVPEVELSFDSEVTGALRNSKIKSSWVKVN